MSDAPQNRPAQAFFGRRVGKPLRPAQAEAVATVLDRLRLDLDQPATAAIGTLFQPPVTDVRLEIGFGGGEHLLAELRAFPEVGFIGVEPFVNGMAKLVTAINRQTPPNLRLYDDDATRVLDWLPVGSVSEIDLLYPDPWPKKRHWKRRFVNPANLDRFARVLKPGGLFRFASDIDGYVNWTLLACRGHGALEWRAQNPADWRTPYPGWQGTRYEAKAIREGRTPAYLEFARQ